jgi:Protein of unknown function (DUF2946)
MDPIVEAALRKWPRVPHCHGWLGLDARGDWYLRDAEVQAAGPFSGAKGSRIEHDGLREFIQRNYAADEGGAWYFQNGPQRVYVELEAAPWVFRLDAVAGRGAERWRIGSRDGRSATCRGCWTDQQGRLFIDCEIGFGLLHTLDVGIAAQAVDAGDWRPQALDFERMPARFGYVLSPAAAVREERV